MSACRDENRTLLDVARGSADGESSETSPNTSASEDDQETMSSNHKLLGKPSKIPVRLTKKSRKSSSQKPNFHSTLSELDILIQLNNNSEFQSRGLEVKSISNMHPTAVACSSVPDKTVPGADRTQNELDNEQHFGTPDLQTIKNEEQAKPSGSPVSPEIILEAPEEFQTFHDIITNCGLDSNAPTHDDDKTKSSPEVNSISMYGQESNKDTTSKNVERGIETGNAPNLNPTQICITNTQENQCGVTEKQTVDDIFPCNEGDLEKLFEVGDLISENNGSEILVINEYSKSEGQLSAACAGNEQILATVKASIEIGVAGCAQAPRCSHISGTTVCAVSSANSSKPASIKRNSPLDNNNVKRKCCSDCDSANGSVNKNCKLETNESANSQHLIWKFVNGRLIFETAPDLNDENEILSSKNLNKRRENHRSRLKILENKLKQAGLTDGKDFLEEQVVDDADYDNEEEALDTFGNCEFDVREVDSFTSNYCMIYDELLDDGENELNYHTNNLDNSEKDVMGTTDEDRARQHNPDRENLKSLLKKPGRDKDAKKKGVVFNETKNEFFDADYIILIREECDYDDEDDDGVCTCNDHEMVRLTCCEPNCNCNSYEEYNDHTPQSPKFAPPLEFVDSVTLSPPEGYKDMELGEQQLLALQHMARKGQRAAVCRDCSATHEDEGSHSDNENNAEAPSKQDDTKEEIPKTDQSQQTTPSTPPPGEKGSANQSQFNMETNHKPDIQLQNIEEDLHRSSSPNNQTSESPITGILKGGRLWKQTSQDVLNIKQIDIYQNNDGNITSDEESNNNKRSVRFIENQNNQRDVCDGAVDKPVEEMPKPNVEAKVNLINASPESVETTLTYKLGSHMLVTNNSLKPNSAVRQLFPQGDCLLTSDSLKAFEEAKRSKLPQIIQSDETDESIKRAIERNTLRRSLIRYEPRPKKKELKTDSLVERIKQLTCDVDDSMPETDEMPPRASPTGEEARKSPEISNKNQDKSFSPSSSSTTSSNSSSSTYKKITDLFAKREKLPDVQTIETKLIAPDLGNQSEYTTQQCPVTRSNSNSDVRKQFLSTLAPLTACVSSAGTEDYYYNRISHQHGGDRSSVTSSVGTEYSLEDIDEGLKNEDEEVKRNTPDVVCGTPLAAESGDELAMFVQQDASRIERIKKKYQQESEDDENDDYGFNKRPSVRGIKPKFGTTTEIIQQIQNQLQPPPTHTKTWPYYSEANLSNGPDNKPRLPQYHYKYVTSNEGNKTKVYRPTSLIEDNMYQNCANQRCNRDVGFRTTVSHPHSPIMRIGGGCNEIYCQVVPAKSRNGRPESPPPLDVNVHQTMVYIPYNHIESYQPGCVSPNPTVQYASTVRVVNHNQINNHLYLEPIYQNQRMVHPATLSKTMVRLPYPVTPQQCDNALPGQYARSTQTSSCNYYPRFRPVYQADPNILYARHSYPRYPPAPDNISLTDSESPLLNGYRYETTFSAQKDSAPTSPTKSRFIERGVPEGAASVSPQDTQNTSTMTSPISPQNLQGKPLFYAMNV